MALPATAVWEVRTTGSANNGGGFDPAVAAPGTDYSQQNAAQVAYTDLVIGSPTTTQLTSAANPFGAAHAGNFIRITGGIGFTAGWYEVLSVVGAVATMDRAVGTAGSTGGTGNLGGAIDHPATIRAAGGVVAGNTSYVRSGSYPRSATLAIATSGLDNAPISWIGYGTVRGDGGQATLLWTGGASTLATGGGDEIWRNWIFDGGNAANIGFSVTGARASFENCSFTRCLQYGLKLLSVSGRARRCLATSCGSGGTVFGGFYTLDASSLLFACAARACTNGFVADSGAAKFFHCLAALNSQSGFIQTGSDGIQVVSCTSAGNTLDGLRFDTVASLEGTLVENSLFANNSGYGMRSVGTNYNQAQLAAFFVRNGFYNNTLGARFQLPAGSLDVTLNVDPFANYAGGDYSLNNDPAGGGLLRGAGEPDGIGLESAPETTAGSLDIGVAQARGMADNGSLRSLWREYTNERNITVIPDATIDLYLDAGLQALNRRVRYHLSDSTTGITLGAGTQEYALPADTVEVLWVEWNGREIQKADMDEWRRRGIDWRAAKAGTPSEWAMYRDRLIVYPPPDAAAVAAQPNPFFRYVSAPPSFTTNGMEQLNTQDRRLAVYYGVAEWAAAHPDSALATLRHEYFMQRFLEEADRVAADYEARGVAR